MSNDNEWQECDPSAVNPDQMYEVRPEPGEKMATFMFIWAAAMWGWGNRDDVKAHGDETEPCLSMPGRLIEQWNYDYRAVQVLARGQVLDLVHLTDNL
jgi:hypothetical protein